MCGDCFDSPGSGGDEFDPPVPDVAALTESIRRNVEATEALTKRLNGLEQRIEASIRRGARKDRDRLVADAVRGARKRLA